MQLHRASYNVWHNVAMLWSTAFSAIEQECKLTKLYPMPSLEISKQMFILAGNSAPGFRPAIDDESAPISLLQNIYINIYQLTKLNYNAIIMEPAKFNMQAPIYYSINHPTFAQNNLEAYRKKTHITLLEEVRRLELAYRQEILKCEYRTQSLYDVVKATEFSFYHHTASDYRQINDSALIPESDPRFLQEHGGEFPKNSQFFRGCIKIAHK